MDDDKYEMIMDLSQLAVSLFESSDEEDEAAIFWDIHMRMLTLLENNR